MSIWERVEDALGTTGLPYAAGLYMGDLPAAFLVYTLISSPPEQHADNGETQRSYRMQVSFYSKTGFTSLAMAGISNAMMAQGFMPGPMRQVPYSQQTGHYGLAMEFVFTE